MIQQIDEIIQAGTVVAAQTSKALVKVDVLGTESDWLPVLMSANSFKKQWSALRVGMQVVVLANRYVLGSIYYKGNPEPKSANDHNDVTEYEDGTCISYDSASKTLSIECIGTVNVIAPNINLGGAGGKKVARVGDVVSVGAGSSAGHWPIVQGSSIVSAA